jgi:hypothetical protein
VSASVTIGALSLCCWGLGVILYTQMATWGLWAILGAGLFMWLGAASSIMCLACALVELARGLEKWGS